MSKRMPMALVMLLLTTVMAAGEARAGLDPDPDSMGVYFDVAGNVAYKAQPLFAPTSVYLILMNPTAGIDGFAVALNLVGASYYIASQDLGGGRVDDDATQSGIRVIAAYPAPPGNAMNLCTWSLMLQASPPLYFHLGPHPDPSFPRDLPVIRRGGQWIRCGTSSGNVLLPVAALNPTSAPVDTEPESFGSIKSLFR